MRDISRKSNSLRTACAEAVLRMAPATLALVRKGGVPKGDPLPVAKVAAIQAAKETSRIIPYCHPLPVDFVGVEFTLGEETITARVEVKAISVRASPFSLDDDPLKKEKGRIARGRRAARRAR